ncbi:hypothetical protein GRI33_09600 [Brucella sp. BO3]|uniref:hypothetical protein n=1 Tax=unclassified Brucella TaxID=2632610 RepID=UPI00084F896E|nr:MULTISPECIES: hypothetical protein [unclassified Brucella]OEI84040.1 hypothetical protein BA060_06135 [Brucella sp. B13-0095]QMV27146.1 hypothetical protein GRI33_09600 [Brucella sp. BO3]
MLAANGIVTGNVDVIDGRLKGIGAGGSYEWANGKYRLYGELAVDTSLNSFADNHSLGGTIGFKVSF